MALVGVSWPWRSVPVWIEDTDVADQALRSVLFTGIGERKMDDAYGGQLLEIIFENKGRVLQALARREIMVAVSQNLPIVTVENIDIVEPEDDNNPVTITVDYEYVGLRSTITEEIVRA